MLGREHRNELMIFFNPHSYRSFILVEGRQTNKIN